MTDHTSPSCRGFKKSGEPCATTIGLSPDGLCMFHDPARAEQVAAMRSKGGKSPRPPRKPNGATIPDDVPAAPKTHDDAVAFASWLTNAAASGRCDARTAHEATFALKEFRAALDKRDIAERYDKLAALMKRMKKCPACAALSTEMDA